MKRGKRTRRAMIRLRHALAVEKFFRWAEQAHPGFFSTRSLEKPHRYPEWHRWHALGRS